MNRKYMHLYAQMADRIEQGEFPEGSLLPSESELMEAYTYSRDTVRKSLNLLESQGYITRVKGKGSVVLGLSRYDFSVSNLISFRELSRHMELPTKTRVINLALEEGPSHIREKLRMEPKDRLWFIARSREIGGKRIILDKDYLNDRFVPMLNTAVCENSLYEYLEKELGLKISFAHKEVVVEHSTEEDRQNLDLDQYDLLVVVRSLVYLQDGEIFQYSESRHRPDRFRFVDFARRIH
ncbi:trehalose operon repressor [Breznakiella homolactica]|uniref:Trehalose operon repressor n=1 Tax=Breznakiella homolactica TaxID=2798577 RepID=A0A7T7XKG9_9SPIR|nr:trehalose operon repressor [Breznakiella homolactica]QQO07917.1 trehalose operon repressor [Breznakiella homolactica]